MSQMRIRGHVAALLMGTLTVVAVPLPAAAGTPAGCFNAPESFSQVSATIAVVQRAADGSLITSQSRLIDPDGPTYESTITVGDTQIDIPSAVDFVVPGTDGALWITTGGSTPTEAQVDPGIGVMYWTAQGGLRPVPQTNQWTVVGVDDSTGRALLEDQRGLDYRWILPDGTDEFLPLVPDQQNFTRYLEFGVDFAYAGDGSSEEVTLYVDGRERDVSDEFADRRGWMSIGAGPVVLEDQNVLVVGIDETVSYPIDDPTLSLRLVGRTEANIYLARQGPVEAEMYRLDLATGSVESIGFGPEGSWVTVFADDDIWLWPVLQEPEGDQFRSELQRLVPLPYDPSFVGDSERSDRIARLYRAFFNRGPDAAGLDFWRASNASGVDIAKSFETSDEFVDTYGSLSREGFVDVVYQNVLGRSPDAAGAAFWTDELRFGLQRGEMMLSFAESPEFIEATATEAPSRLLDASIERLYQAYFDRSPDRGGLCFWSDQIVVGGRDLADVSADFEQSPEFADLYGALDDEAFIALVYRNVLDREPDAAGLAFWLDALGRRGAAATRGGLMLQFAESPEFKAATDTL